MLKILNKADTTKDTKKKDTDVANHSFKHKV